MTDLMALYGSMDCIASAVQMQIIKSSCCTIDHTVLISRLYKHNPFPAPILHDIPRIYNHICICRLCLSSRMTKLYMEIVKTRLLANHHKHLSAEKCKRIHQSTFTLKCRTFAQISILVSSNTLKLNTVIAAAWTQKNYGYILHILILYTGSEQL